MNTVRKNLTTKQKRRRAVRGRKNHVSEKNQNGRPKKKKGVRKYLAKLRGDREGTPISQRET